MDDLFQAEKNTAPLSRLSYMKKEGTSFSKELIENLQKEFSADLTDEDWQSLRPSHDEFEHDETSSVLSSEKESLDPKETSDDIKQLNEMVRDKEKSELRVVAKVGESPVKEAPNMYITYNTKPRPNGEERGMLDLYLKKTRTTLSSTEYNKLLHGMESVEFPTEDYIEGFISGYRSKTDFIEASMNDQIKALGDVVKSLSAQNSTMGRTTTDFTNQASKLIQVLTDKVSSSELIMSNFTEDLAQSHTPSLEDFKVQESKRAVESLSFNPKPPSVEHKAVSPEEETQESVKALNSQVSEMSINPEEEGEDDWIKSLLDFDALSVCQGSKLSGFRNEH
ncbi:TPA_asm: protein 2 [Frullania virus 1]|uniref:Protein 2 n=1 Tax=Frullania virus 1 TaxID=2977968 RepID=A0A9N6YJB0_9RHAB|nr:TPA_asm: protein 2 [Frullania virus 1]